MQDPIAHLIRMMMPPARPLDEPLRVSARVPKARPEGSLPPVHIAIVSDLRTGAECASGDFVERRAPDFVALIRSAQDRSLTVSIDCRGGLSESAKQIAAALLNHRRAVHVRIVGKCSSAAVIIALAGDSCVIAPDGMVLLHLTRRYYTREGYESFMRQSWPDRLAIVAGMYADDDELVAHAMARTGRPLTTVRGWFEADRPWTAEEAVNNGFADFIDRSICGTLADRLKANALPFARAGVGYNAGQAVECDGRIYVTQRRLSRCRPDPHNTADWLHIGELSQRMKDVA